ncbi:nucleoside monophosphate kinase [Candidatus Poribacteria bacterium]|nr:nucleoside monophosphate kinase [Candidatus Poribacteria bacterium]
MNKEQHYQTILLFGAPGAGKGTQGKILGSIPGFFHLSCGDVFRTFDVASELGKIVYEYSSRGELVPDEITIKIWQEKIHNHTVLNLYKRLSDLLVLDGIPRSANQAELMDEHIDVLRVIHLVCDNQDEMIKRLRRRALKENRVDDAREDVIRRRWEVYKKETQPVLDHYPQSLISTVDAIGSPAEVLQNILKIVIPVQNAHFAHAV